MVANGEYLLIKSITPNRVLKIKIDKVSNQLKLAKLDSNQWHMYISFSKDIKSNPAQFLLSQKD